MQDIDQKWRKLGEEVMSGMKEWRDQNPRATFVEIEGVLDQLLNSMRARMLEDLALASPQADWSQADPSERPICPHCGTKLVSRGKKSRSFQTQGGQQVVLKRSYGVCPTCGVGFFPPGRGIETGGRGTESSESRTPRPSRHMDAI